MGFDILAYIILGWLYLTGWFFAVGTYLRLERDNKLRKLPRFIYWSLYTVLIPGVLLDFLFNLTYGSLHYKSLPKDWLFSGTTARIIREEGQLGRWGNPSERLKRAERWRDVLNTIDPGHIK